MGNIIEIKHLTKKIENQLILSDINLCFEEEHIYDYQDCMEVIGNKIDNPGLLG